MTTANPHGEELAAFIERIESLTEEKAAIQDQIKDVYAEAKGRGYDTAIMREVVKLRKMSPDDRAEQETVLETYMIALGMS